MNKDDISIALSDTLSIRHLKEMDVGASYMRALNDRERVKYMTSLGDVVSHSDIILYVRDNYTNPHHLLMGVFAGDELLGTCRLHDIDQQVGTAHLGIFIFEDRTEYKGLGTSVIKAVSDFAFQSLGLESVYAGIFTDNIPSVRAFTKARFVIVDQAQYHGRIYQKWVRHRAD